MTNYSDYNIPTSFNKTIKEEYVRTWIAQQLALGIQPTEEQISAQYSQVPPTEQAKYKMVSYTKNVVSTEVPVPQVTITYSSAHGTAPASKTVNTGYLLTSADLPTLSEEGWTFKGWDKQVGALITANTTITASWEEVAQMDYLTFTAQQAGSTIGMTHYGTNKTTTKPHIDYQINDGEWVTEWNGASTITLQNVGDYVKMKGHNESGFSGRGSVYNRSKFTMTGSIAGSGNIMSLIDAEKDGTKTIPNEHCFLTLFNGCYSLMSIPELPATELKQYCYNDMFSSCTNLTIATKLPATTLAIGCYYSMFYNCTNLVVAPDLPAITLAENCYNNMFEKCANITQITLKNGITDIPQRSLSYICPSIIIPNSVITINNQALYCGELWEYDGNLVSIICNNVTYTYNGEEVFYIKLANGTDVYLNIWTQKSCFLPGTQITLADNTTKAIEDITYSDDILVWNADEGKLDSAKPVWLTRSGLHNDHYYKLTFSDGTVLKVTGQNSNHKMYDMDQQKFVGCAYAKPGDRIYSLNGIVTVVSNEYIEENVEYYNIQTDQHINCFAEGILTSDRYGNLYPHDENMKYVKDDRPIRPYSEFEAAGISQYWYDHLRMGESTESVEEAAKYIRRCESQMLPLPTE